MSANSTNENPSNVLRQEVRNLPTYDPGSDVEDVQKRHGLNRIIKLSNNENPLGMSPAATTEIRKQLETGSGRYPDPVGKKVLASLSRIHDIPQNRIILGNGSENILELLCLAFLTPKAHVLTPSPCFSLYEIFPLMMGATVNKVSLSNSFELDHSAWLESLTSATRLIFVSNPSNPAGSTITLEDLTLIASNRPHDSVLVIDEAYYEYAMDDPDFPDAITALRRDTKPWIVLRTFSKAYGLAGLRIGYGVASHAHLTNALNRVRTPYNVNHLAQAAALAAVRDRGHLRRSIDLVNRERARLTESIQALGLKVAPSRSNFLFIDCGIDSRTLAQRLEQEGVIIKAWQEKGYESFIRVSVSLPEENDIFLKSLKTILATG